jgi:hypothetical protein
VHLPDELKPFEYKVGQIDSPPEVQFPEFGKDPAEALTGYVHGQKASDLEERFAKALDQFGLQYQFQFEVASAYGLPGEEKTIDFLVDQNGMWIPIEIGATFTHGSVSKQEIDRKRESILNPILVNMGIQPLGDPLYTVLRDRPLSIEDAKEIVLRMFVRV